jgi:outer membrane murein-binding lipoprotein Lpp
MRRAVAVLAVIGILGLVLGCQQPAGTSGKLDQMEKDMAELKANVDKLAQAMDD